MPGQGRQGGDRLQAGALRFGEAGDVGDGAGGEDGDGALGDVEHQREARGLGAGGAQDVAAADVAAARLPDVDAAAPTADEQPPRYGALQVRTQRRPARILLSRSWPAPSGALSEIEPDRDAPDGEGVADGVQQVAAVGEVHDLRVVDEEGKANRMHLALLAAVEAELTAALGPGRVLGHGLDKGIVEHGVADLRRLLVIELYRRGHEAVKPRR